MISVFLTQYDGVIIGPVARLLGYLMNGIFVVLDKIGIPNIGLAIILFTIIIYLLLTPLTIKQQKFSKLSAKMNPEIQAIQAKYKNKKDQDSMARMNEETKAVYAKYGVSPTGSCVQLIIQMPILFALYRVIYNFPAYVTKVKDLFIPFVSELINQPGAKEFISNTDNFKAASQFSKLFNNDLFVSGDKTFLTNTFIDVLNRASTAEWNNLADNFPSLGNLITNAQGTGALDLLHRYNNFLGMNIGDSPSYMVKEAFASKQFGLLIAGILVPLLAAATQWINTKLMPQQENNANQDNNAMAASMKTMNMTMPLMSAVFCFTLPAGMGIYWIAGAVIRSIQQVVINKKIDKLDLDAIIEKNMEKQAKKIEKAGVDSKVLSNSSKISTKTIVDTQSELSQSEKDEKVKKATEYYNKGVKPDSLAAKANMVKAFNEKNTK